jgi:hypothetical protein
VGWLDRNETAQWSCTAVNPTFVYDICFSTRPGCFWKCYGGTSAYRDSVVMQARCAVCQWLATLLSKRCTRRKKASGYYGKELGCSTVIDSPRERMRKRGAQA